MIRSLQSTTLFRGLDDGEVKFLLRQCGRRRVEASEPVFEEQDRGENLYYILEGEVYLTRRIGEEEEFLALLETGGTFGEAGLFLEGVRTATVRAKRRTILLVLEKPLLEGLPSDLASKLTRNIAATSAEKLSLANRIIDRLYQQLRSLQPKEPDWEDAEEDFVKGFEEDPKI